MPGIEIKLKGSALRAFKRGGTARRAVRKSTTRARIDSAKTMERESIQVVRESKRIKVAHIKKSIEIRKGTNKGWGIEVRGGRTPLIHYPVRKTSKGVSVEINVGKRKIYHGAFIATMPNSKGVAPGHKGVFKKEKGAKRLKIFEMLGTRTLDVLKKRKNQERIQRAGRKAFTKTFKRNFKALASK